MEARKWNPETLSYEFPKDEKKDAKKRQPSGMYGTRLTAEQFGKLVAIAVKDGAKLPNEKDENDKEIPNKPDFGRTATHQAVEMYVSQAVAMFLAAKAKIAKK
jgi:hypothetical protein